MMISMGENEFVELSRRTNMMSNRQTKNTLVFVNVRELSELCGGEKHRSVNKAQSPR